MNEINIIFLSPGPIYDIESDISQRKLATLSQYSKGYLFATADKNQLTQIGNFTCYTMARGKKIVPFWFLGYCITNAWKIRRQGKQVDCVVTYDPLTTGLIGWFVKLIFSAKLIVEVNGVYTSPVIWEENTGNFVTRLKKFIVPLFMKFVLSVADGIYLLFPAQISHLQNITKKKTIVSFPCWVPVSFFKNLGENKEVLFVGFPLKVKGLDILIKAFKNIAPDFPDWKLKILGWYPDIEELENEIDGHAQIYHHQPVPYAEIPEHIGTCGILVLPSRTEAMGRVLVEAASAGKARIASNVDGIPTVVRDNIDGFLFESQNVEELAEKMALLMRDSNLRNQLGNAAQARAKIEFSEDMFITRTLDFYKKVMSK